MTPKTDLFELIKSMSKNEKGYFKRFCARQEGKKKYILLFDHLEQQSRTPPGEYNETELLKIFKKEKFVKNFSVAKSYLYDSILESLHNYHAESSSEAVLNRMFHYLEILFAKGLYKQCNEQLKKIIKIAVAYEKHYHITHHYMWKLRLFNINGYKKIKRNELHDNFKHTNEALNAFANNIKLNMLGNELTFIIASEGSATSKNVNNELEQLIKKIQSDVFEESESIRLKIAQRTTLLYYLFYVKKDIEKSFENIKECLDIFEQNKKLINEDLLTYITLHANMLVIAARSKYQNAFFKSLIQIRELNTAYKNKITPRQSANIFERSYISELGFYIRNNQFDKINDVIDDITIGLEKHHESSSDFDRSILLGNIGILYYCNNNPKQALKWFYRLINLDGTKARPDIIAIAKVLSILIHYELENYDLVFSQMRSTKKLLREKKLLSTIEMKILNYILFNSKRQPDIFERNKITENLIREIETQLNTIDREDSSFYFDYKVWLNSKLNNLTYAQTIKKQVNYGG